MLSNQMKKRAQKKKGVVDQLNMLERRGFATTHWRDEATGKWTFYVTPMPCATASAARLTGAFARELLPIRLVLVATEVSARSAVLSVFGSTLVFTVEFIDGQPVPTTIIPSIGETLLVEKFHIQLKCACACPDQGPVDSHLAPSGLLVTVAR
eukprot:SAG11_NODE_1579_length_4652_cov_5.253459_3_plen_153_part_00